MCCAALVLLDVVGSGCGALSCRVRAQSMMTAKRNGLLSIRVGKCQHLPTWFGKSPEWKRFPTIFGLLPPHYGKC